MHNSNIISRMIPAPRAYEITSSSQGTRVAVRDLFGNMAVRVKQRLKLLEDRNEQERTWLSLKREIIGHVLAWNKPLSLTVQDVQNQRQFKLRPRISHIHSRRIALRYLQEVLTQSSYLANYTDEWVSLSVNTLSIRISGAISKVPKQSKSIQFISIGITPIRNFGLGSELYDDVNRVFDLSSFGYDCDEELMHDSRSDRINGITWVSRHSAKREQKSLERWPMFHLNIRLKEPSKPLAEMLTERQLQTISQVLQKAISEWLAVQGYTVQSKRRRHLRQDPRSEHENSRSPSRASRNAPSKQLDGVSDLDGEEKRVSAAKFPGRPSNSESEQPQRLPSRQVLEEVRHGGESWKPNTTQPSAHIGPVERQGMNTNKRNRLAREQDEDPFQISTVDNANNDKQDDRSNARTINGEAVLWKDPISSRIVNIDTRTGNVLPVEHAASNSRSLRSSNQRLSLRPTTDTTVQSRESCKDIPWIQDFMMHWKNPVFNPPDSKVLNVASVESAATSNINSYGKELDLRSKKLNKSELRSSTVLGQLDLKFVIILMNTRTAVKDSSSNHKRSRTLVLVDQHAADERCKVEALLADFCHTEPMSDPDSKSLCVKHSELEKPILFETSKEESRLILLNCDKFARWGIKIEKATCAVSDVSSSSVISIKTVPKLIAERCRSEPRLLINILRSETRKLSEERQGHDQRFGDRANKNSKKHNAWRELVGLLPKGILDMINSRACRSAIMFNDVLTQEDCINLVKNLANCSLPFQCAHGRPSMIPLIEFGNLPFSSGRFSTTGAFGNLYLDQKRYRTVRQINDFGVSYREWRR